MVLNNLSFEEESDFSKLSTWNLLSIWKLELKKISSLDFENVAFTQTAKLLWTPIQKWSKYE